MRFMKTQMKSIVTFLAWISLLLCSPTVYGGEISLGEIVSKVQKNYQSMKDYSAKFNQETKIKAYPRPQYAKGEVYYKKPGKMRWDYTEPEKKEIVTDGKTLWMYTPSLDQVIKADYAKTDQSRIATAFLSGMGSLKRDFEISLAEDEKKNGNDSYSLSLVPKEGTDSIKVLVLTVDRKTFQLKKSKTIDLYDNVTIVTYFDYKINSGLEDSVFDFHPPEGVDIVTPPDMR